MKLSYKYHTWEVPVWVLRWLKRRMRWVRAAGGVVTAEDGTMLLIERNGRWDLPKGKVEEGETLLQAALREVEEETGVRVGSGEWRVESGGRRVESGERRVGSGECRVESGGRRVESGEWRVESGEWGVPVKTYHIFNLYGGWHLKQTSWFAMRAEKAAVRPQEEEGITAGCWVSPEEWHRRLEGSYGTLRTLSRRWTN